MHLFRRDVPMGPARRGCNEAAKLGAGLQGQTDFYRIAKGGEPGGLDIDQVEFLIDVSQFGKSSREMIRGGNSLEALDAAVGAAGLNRTMKENEQR